MSLFFFNFLLYCFGSRLDPIMTDTESSNVSMEKDRTTSSVSSGDQSTSESNDMDTKSSVSEPKGTVPTSIQEIKKLLYNWDESRSNTIPLSYSDQLPSNSKSMEKQGVRFAIVEAHVHATFPAGFRARSETCLYDNFCYTIHLDWVSVGQLRGNLTKKTLNWCGV